ncbi:MAG TPA: TlpA disulfide reductase family protein [Pyrinomonadaceae bacterium]
MTENRSSAPRSWITTVVVVLLCVVNVLLIKQNFDLRKKLAGGAKIIDLTKNYLQPGDTVAEVTATGFDGQPREIDYKKGGKPRLVLFFSPTCQYCKHQMPMWRDLLDKVDSNRFDVVGVVSDREDKNAVSVYADGAGYFKTKTPLPLVFFDSEALGSYKLTATPTTLLISSEGKVEHAWIGKWDETSAMEVADALK